MGKPLELPVPDGLGCDDVYERAIGAGFGEREAGTAALPTASRHVLNFSLSRKWPV